MTNSSIPKTFGNTTLFSTESGIRLIKDLVVRELHMSLKAQEEIEDKPAT